MEKDTEELMKVGKQLEVGVIGPTVSNERKSDGLPKEQQTSREESGQDQPST